MHNGQEITLAITHLGGLGDGVAERDGQAVFVPFAAPGDRVRAVVEQVGKDFIRARLVEVMEPGPGRQPAPCAHFGVCGGCTLQHVTPEAYREFKRGILLHALRRAGYDPACMKEMVVVGEGARRRAEFGVAVHKGEVTLGFSEARSHRIENITECPVLRPAILALLPALRDAIARLRKPGQVRGVFVTETEKGLDVLMTFAVPPAASDRERLAAFAADNESIVRLCLREAEGGLTPIFERGAVEQRCGNTYVEIPPGAFLQATEGAVQAITGIILRVLEGCKSVADIYSGLGTYSLPLVEAGCRVSAFEGDAGMVAALHNAAWQQGLETMLTAAARDLVREPLSERALSVFDAVVINPPRNGAGPQTAQLAKSSVPVVVMVSCNPATFARDAATLKDGGYALVEATPIDQFLWSAHLELVAVFKK